MAASRKMPSTFRDGFKQLLLLSDAQFQELERAIHEAYPAMSPGAFNEELLKHAPSIPSADLKQIVAAVGSILISAAKRQIDQQQLADSLQEGWREENLFSGEDDKQLRQRIDRLLVKQSSFETSVKASDILTQHQFVFLNCRCFTDIRPVFGDVTKEPSGAVLVHHLKLSYADGDDDREIYLALDTDDLKNLQECLKRAQDKEISLASLLHRAGVANLSGGAN